MTAVSSRRGQPRIERGQWGPLPWAALGQGTPLVVLTGLWPVSGVDSDSLVRGSVAPVQRLRDRRLIVVNRWRGMPLGLTMGELADTVAPTLREHLAGPVDLLGMSTGGSIAQQVAAEHPDVVRRLVLVSTGARLGPRARAEQAEVAAELRAGRVRAAAGLLARDLVPAPLAFVADLTGRAFAHQVLPDDTAVTDLRATLEAEDAFELTACPPIQAPTLLVTGARDQFYPPSLAEETARAIPDCRLEIVPGRGHVDVMRDPRAATAIGRFLGGEAALT